MSADNFLYVGKRGERWAIVDRSASCEDYSEEISDYERVISEHDYPFAAHLEAARLDQTGDYWTEYGVVLSPAIRAAFGFSKRSCSGVGHRIR